jgi:hypothetical protein
VIRMILIRMILMGRRAPKDKEQQPSQHRNKHHLTAIFYYPGCH